MEQEEKENHRPAQCDEDVEVANEEPAQIHP